jgi:hypothetical protein
MIAASSRLEVPSANSDLTSKSNVTVAIVAYERDDAIGFGERNRPHDDRHTYISICQSVQAAADARRHCCFRAQSAAQVRAFHTAGLRAGGKDDGAPGLRNYHPEYYAAFLLDPEGNKVEAVYHNGAT